MQWSTKPMMSFYDTYPEFINNILCTSHPCKFIYCATFACNKNPIEARCRYRKVVFVAKKFILMKQVKVRLRAPIKTLYLNRKSKQKVQTTLFIESTYFFLTPSQKMNRPNLRRKTNVLWKKLCNSKSRRKNKRFILHILWYFPNEINIFWKFEFFEDKCTKELAYGSIWLD
jgi:hypothetical protein